MQFITETNRNQRYITILQEQRQNKKGGWAVAQSWISATTVTLERLRKRGYEAMLDYYLKVSPQLKEPLYTSSTWPALCEAEGHSGLRGAPHRLQG
jgi:hypothetical protein